MATAWQGAKSCVGLEPLLAWDSEQMEVRLEDHFLNRKNDILERHLAPIRAIAH